MWLTICDTCLDRLEREKRMRGGDLTDCVRKVQFLSSSPILGLELCPHAEAEGAIYHGCLLDCQEVLGKCQREVKEKARKRRAKQSIHEVYEMVSAGRAFRLCSIPH